MSKYNRKFIVRYRQFERWHNMNEKLSRVITLSERFECGSPADIQAMKVIHKLLCECRSIAENRLKETKIDDRILR